RLRRGKIPALESLFVPWYTRDGLPVCHDPARIKSKQFPNAHVRYPQAGDIAITVREAASPSFIHPWCSPEAVEKYRAMRWAKDIFPVYAVPSGYLLLNGNHRSIAIVRDNAELFVRKFAVSDSAICRDSLLRTIGLRAGCSSCRQCKGEGWLGNSLQRK